MKSFDTEESYIKQSARREAIDERVSAKREVLAYDTKESRYYPCDIGDVGPGQFYIQDGQEKQKPFNYEEPLVEIDEALLKEENLLEKMRNYKSSKFSNSESSVIDGYLDEDKSESYEDFDNEDEVVTYLDGDGVLDSVYLSQVPAGGYYTTKNGEYLQKPFKLSQKFNVEEVEPLLDDDIPWDFDPDEAERERAEKKLKR